MTPSLIHADPLLLVGSCWLLLAPVTFCLDHPLLGGTPLHVLPLKKPWRRPRRLLATSSVLLVSSHPSTTALLLFLRFLLPVLPILYCFPLLIFPLCATLPFDLRPLFASLNFLRTLSVPRLTWHLLAV